MKHLEWYIIGGVILAVWYFSPKKLSGNDASYIPQDAPPNSPAPLRTNITDAPKTGVNTLVAGVYIPPPPPPTNYITPPPNDYGVVPPRPKNSNIIA